MIGVIYHSVVGGLKQLDRNSGARFYRRHQQRYKWIVLPNGTFDTDTLKLDDPSTYPPGTIPGFTWWQPGFQETDYNISAALDFAIALLNGGTMAGDPVGFWPDTQFVADGGTGTLYGFPALRPNSNSPICEMKSYPVQATGPTQSPSAPGYDYLTDSNFESLPGTSGGPIISQLYSLAGEPVAVTGGGSSASNSTPATYIAGFSAAEYASTNGSMTFCNSLTPCIRVRLV
jgi:hypothetical protein